MTHYPDHSWSEKDRNGHKHSFADGEIVDLPTLRVLFTGSRWCEECGESHVHHTYVCNICGIRVEPRFTTRHPSSKVQKAKKLLNAIDFSKVAPPAPPYTGSPSKGLEIKDISIEAYRPEAGISRYTSSGVAEFVAAGSPRYTLTVNSGEITVDLSEEEIKEASRGASKGREGMIQATTKILRDRGHKV